MSPPSSHTPGCDLYAMVVVTLDELAKQGKLLLVVSKDYARQSYLRAGGDPGTLRPVTDWEPYEVCSSTGARFPGLRMTLKGTWKGPGK